MNPKEKQNIEYQIQEKKEEKNEILKLPKDDILKGYEWYEDFKKSVFLDPNYKKDSILTILEKADELELQMYFDTNLEDKNFINFNINDFITNFKWLINEKKNEEKWENEEKQDYWMISGINDDTWNDKISKITKESKKTKEDEQKKWKDNLIEFIPKYKELFAWDKEISEIIKNIENNIDNPSIVKVNLEKLVTDEKIRKRFFDGLAKTKDATLYQETIQLFTNYWISLPPSIPREIYEVQEKWKTNTPPDIISQFPWAKPEDIEKRWDLVSYWDKTIDLKTGKAYISGEGWYAIETSMQVPNSLDLRVAYQKERLEILDEIKTNENKIYEVKEYQKTLQYEKTLHEQYEKIALNHDIDSNLAKAEIESQLLTIKKYKELVEERYPTMKEDPEKFKNEREKEIEQSKEKLTNLKTDFDKNMQKLREAWQDEIRARDEKVRETISFLDDLWITNINQHDLQKIINRININPQTYGFSKPIDLKKWFEEWATESHQQKKEFFNLFWKIYKKMWIELSWKDFMTDYKKIKTERWNKKEEFDINFKELLFNWWSFKIETFFNIINEKPEKK